MRQADFAAQVLEADALVRHHGLHHGSLGHGQFAARYFGFERLTQRAANAAQVAFKAAGLRGDIGGLGRLNHGAFLEV